MGGGVSERFMEPVLKTGVSEMGRGFESHPSAMIRKSRWIVVFDSCISLCGEIPKWLKGGMVC